MVENLKKERNGGNEKRVKEKIWYVGIKSKVKRIKTFYMNGNLMAHVAIEAGQVAILYVQGAVGGGGGHLHQ